MLYYYCLKTSYCYAPIVLDSSHVIHHLALSSTPEPIPPFKLTLPVADLGDKHVENDMSLSRLFVTVKRAIESPKELPELTSDLRCHTKAGTALQQKVWHYLVTRTQPGDKVTYSDITAGIGEPSSMVRAVANAIGANNIAVLIPCHRVVRKDGSMGGYRWGLEHKVKLLALEDTQ